MKFFILLTIISFVFVAPVKATVFFEDNFNRINVFDAWEYSSQYGIGVTSWTDINGQLVSEVNQHEGSFLYIKNIGPLNNYIFFSDVRSLSGVDQSFVFRVSQDRKSYYQVDLRYSDPYWPQDGNNIKLLRFNNGYYVDLAIVSPSGLNNTFEMTQSVDHKFKVVFDRGNIKIYFDSVLIINYNDMANEALFSGGVGLKNWGGDYFQSSIKNVYDNVRITSLDEPDVPTPTLTPSPTETPTPTLTPTNTPVPTATPTPKRKIIILPGLGAGWNAEAILNNKIVPDSEWAMNEWATNYVGLTKALDAKGLVFNQDYFVWNYDWRRSIGEIVIHFNKFVNDKIGTGEKVDLVGHSLGGLVARSWSQDHKDDLRLGKIMTLGSPNFGTVKAYDAWNGGMVSDNYDLSSIGMNVILQLQKSKYGTTIDALHANVPVVKDLLPTFDFLKKNGVSIPIAAMESKNEYFLTKNLTANQMFDKYKAVVAVGHDTKAGINLGERNVFDKVLGFWPEGSPINYSYDVGDGTVLKKSAKFDGDDYSQVSAMHGWMVNASMQSIFSELGLGSVANSDMGSDYSNYLVYYLGSPAVMSVTCGTDIYHEDSNGFVVFENKNYSGCRLNLMGTGGGTYHLVTGKVGNDNSWNYFENNILAGQTASVIFDPSAGTLMTISDNKDYLWDLVVRDIKLLQLKSLTGLAEKRKTQGLLERIFEFRKKKGELVITERILDNLELIMAIENKKNFFEARWAHLLSSWDVERIEKKLEPSVFAAISYKKMMDEWKAMNQDFKDKNYNLVWARSEIIKGLLKEVRWSLVDSDH